MSPSKPLTAEQKLRRKQRREQARFIASVMAGGLVRDPAGRLGYFVPAAHDPSMRPGQARIARL